MRKIQESLEPHDYSGIMKKKTKQTKTKKRTLCQTWENMLRTVFGKWAISQWLYIKLEQILKVHFTVTGGNKAAVDLVLIVKTTVTLLCKHVVLTQTTVNFLNIIFIRKRRRFVSKQGQPQPHNHSTARTLSVQL